MQPATQQLPQQQRKKPVPFPVPIDEINPLASFYPGRYATLFRVCYLYGARIGEALKLKGGDFKISIDEYGREVLIATLLTEKNKKNPIRILPAITKGPDLNPFQKEEKEITIKVLEYLEDLKLTGLLFEKISRQMAHNAFSKQAINIRAIQFTPETNMVDLPEFKLHPHYLRHCRLTHLREEYEYDSVALMQYAGWTDPRPVMIYLQLDWRHLAKAMKPGAR